MMVTMAFQQSLLLPLFQNLVCLRIAFDDRRSDLFSHLYLSIARITRHMRMAGGLMMMTQYTYTCKRQVNQKVKYLPAFTKYVVIPSLLTSCSYLVLQMSSLFSVTAYLISPPIYIYLASIHTPYLPTYLTEGSRKARTQLPSLLEQLRGL